MKFNGYWLFILVISVFCSCKKETTCQANLENQDKATVTTILDWLVVVDEQIR